jgi:hypothetical protein
VIAESESLNTDCACCRLVRTRVCGGSADLIWESSAEQPLRGGRGEDRERVARGDVEFP